VPGIAAVLIAAGESSRMGRPKPLLPWAGRTLVSHQVAALDAAGAKLIIVVLGHAAHEVAPHVTGPDSLCVVVNPDYLQGKTTSVKRGLREVGPESAGVLLLAVDQPRPSDLIARVIREHLDSGALITQPTYQGRGGHPVIFSTELLPELLAITEEGQGVREVMERHSVETLRAPLDTPLARLDVNTPEEYERGVELYGQWS
jgi:molybdenum cofactor cytidylyltransferase